MVLLTVLCFLLSVQLSFSVVTPNPEQLVALINKYRESLSLPKVPISYTLSKLAQAHADNMAASGLSVACSYQKPSCTQNCGLHSWGKPPKEGLWNQCCYNPKNPNPHCMWDKPMEFTKDWVAPLVPFRNDAVENAAIIYGVPTNNTEIDLLNMWKTSLAQKMTIPISSQKMGGM